MLVVRDADLYPIRKIKHSTSRLQLLQRDLVERPGYQHKCFDERPSNSRTHSGAGDHPGVDA